MFSECPLPNGWGPVFHTNEYGTGCHPQIIQHQVGVAGRVAAGIEQGNGIDGSRN